MSYNNSNYLGTLVPFDTTNGLHSPSSNGFLGGTFVDGNDVYVGVASNCDETRSPVALFIDPSFGNVLCSNVTKPRNSLDYMRYHPNLYWLPLGSSATGFPTVLQVITPSNGKTYFIGRIFTVGVTYIGRVIPNNGKHIELFQRHK